jgi:hypothetical protein
MDEAQSEPRHLRARIRCLVNAREVPRVIERHSMEPKPCDVCGKSIAQGSPEYEVGFSTLTFRLDADRYAIWTDEMLRS